MNNYSHARCARNCISTPGCTDSFTISAPLAMAYVPMQEFKTVFDLCEGLKNGTIFPELYKPFLGSKGGCKC